MKVTSNRPGILWQVILVFLIVMDGILLSLTVISPNLRVTTLHNMGLFDLIVSIILLIVFIWRIRVSKISNREYFRENWTDIIALIPIYFITFQFFGIDHPTILVKILIIIKIVAMYWFARKIGEEVIVYQAKTRLVYALAFFLVVFFFCSFIFYWAEHGVNPEVATFDDSIWFVLQTITTVGYGDIIPVTGIGRLMGVMSMFSALVLTSIVTSVATFSLIEKFRKGTEELAEKTSTKVKGIDGKLDSIKTRLDELENINDINKNIEAMKLEIKDLKELIKNKK
jgi:voltage-gated potassium channel